MTFHRRLFPISALGVVLLVVSMLRAEAPATQPVVPESFMRFVDDGHGGGSLQTADVTFDNGHGVAVDLIGAVHIGEKAYYSALNQDFRGYDAVLYELIKPKGMTMPPPGQGVQSDNPITDFQRFLKNTLDLDFQLDDIDYTVPNFVHADMDKETFERMQAERGETFEQIMIRQIVKAFTEPENDKQLANEPSADDLLKIFTRPDMERQVKVVVAKQLGDMDLSAMGLDGPNGSVLVTERNKAALGVLSETIAAGKKKIAIFYGAAHLPDMTKRLESMGFSPVSTRWNVAWDLTIRADQPSAVEKIMNDLIHSMGDDNN